MTGARLAGAVALLLVAGCATDSEPPARLERMPFSGQALRREIAGQLLAIEQNSRALRAWVFESSIESRLNRIASLDEVERQIAFCAELLAREPIDDRAARQAEVGAHLTGVAYDLIRIDVEATRRGQGGTVRKGVNWGLDRLFAGMKAMRADPAWAESEAATAAVLDATFHRDNLLRVAPIANVFATGVKAANTWTFVVGLPALARGGAAALSRLAEWMRGGQLPGAALELGGVGAGGAVQLRLVSSAGSLALTDAEVIGLSQAGVISAAASSLYMMANGGPRDRTSSAANEGPQGGRCSRTFKQGELARHHGKHGSNVASLLGESSLTADQYLADANLVIREGTWAPEINAYVRLVGGKGPAKAAVVGLTHDGVFITTFHIDTVERLARSAPSLGWSL